MGRHHDQRPPIPDGKHRDKDNTNDPADLRRQWEWVSHNSSHSNTGDKGDTEGDRRP